MSGMASEITSLTTVYSTVYSGADHRKHQSSASLAFVRGIYRWLVKSPHKGPVTRKMSLSGDVIMNNYFHAHYALWAAASFTHISLCNPQTVPDTFIYLTSCELTYVLKSWPIFSKWLYCEGILFSYLAWMSEFYFSKLGKHLPTS